MSITLKRKWKIYLWEWDPTNGEYVYRDRYGEEIEARSEDELWKLIEKRLAKMARDAKKEGWDCELNPQGELVCVKYGKYGYDERIIGYDINPV